MSARSLEPARPAGDEVEDSLTTAALKAAREIEARDHEEAESLLWTLQELQSWMSRLAARLSEEKEGPDGPEAGQLLRSTLGCVLVDRINPAVEDLARALHCLPVGRSTDTC